MWHGSDRHERHCGPRGGWDRWAAEQRFAGPGGAMRGGGRQRRMFDGSELRLVLLRLIADETRHGYELIRAIEALTGGAYAPSPGVVYPTLSLLDEMGLIAEQRSDDARKRFAITGDGQRHLDERQAEVDALFARLAALASHRERHRGGPVRRAMANLAVAIEQRVAAGDVDEDVLHRIADVIDGAARTVERLK